MSESKLATFSAPKDSFLLLDIAKGIGIILVVASHTDWLKNLNILVFWFHMPFFFFLSGFLYSPRPFKAFAAQRSKKLLQPYFIFLFILALPAYASFYASGSGQEAFRYTVKLLYGGKILINEHGVFWFITCLFLVQQLYNLAFHHGGLRGKKLLALAVLMAILAYTNPFFGNVRFPWAMNVVPMAFVFYYLGHCSASALKDGSWARLNTGWAVFAATAVVLLAAFLHWKIAYHYDMKSSSYGIPFLGLALNLVGIWFIFLAARLCLYLPFAGVLSQIGQASMFIMYIHRIIQQHLENTFVMQILIALLVPFVIYLFCRRFLVLRNIFQINTVKDSRSFV